MEFSELVLKRQSDRKYKDKKIEDEKLEKCLEAARMAPSACNSQPWTIIVVDDPELKEKVASETYNAVVSFNKFVHTAPVILVIVAEKPALTAHVGSILKDLEYNLIDTGIVAEHICLQAAELGLGTCMLGWFNEKPIKKLLNIPKRKKIGLMIAIGYPEYPETRVKKRKTLDEIVKRNSYK